MIDQMVSLIKVVAKLLATEGIVVYLKRISAVCYPKGAKLKEIVDSIKSTKLIPWLNTPRRTYFRIKMRS